MDYQALGQRIRRQRKWLELSQESVASMIVISASFYGHVERGTRKVSIETLLALARVLGTTPDALLGIGSKYDEFMPSQVLECVCSMRILLDQIEEYYGTKESRKKETRSHTGQRI